MNATKQQTVKVGQHVQVARPNGTIARGRVVEVSASGFWIDSDIGSIRSTVDMIMKPAAPLPRQINLGDNPSNVRSLDSLEQGCMVSAGRVRCFDDAKGDTIEQINRAFAAKEIDWAEYNRRIGAL